MKLPGWALVLGLGAAVGAIPGMVFGKMGPPWPWGGGAGGNGEAAAGATGGAPVAPSIRGIPGNGVRGL